MNNNITLLRDYLKKHNALNHTIDTRIRSIVNVLDSKLTLAMKIQLVSHFFCVYASQFRIPILLDKQLIPVNSIAFLFSYSGSGKDTTINIIKSIFKESFEKIQSTLDLINIETAELKAESNNKKASEYIVDIPPLEIGISTTEGLVKSLDNLNQMPFGSININTNEFMNELSSSTANIINMLSSIAEMYDIGYKNSKQLKDKSNEVKAIEGIFLSALFTSSFNVLQDGSSRNKLINEFKSRFARRASITFNSIVDESDKINDLEQWLSNSLESNKKKLEAIDKQASYFNKMTSLYLQNRPKCIQMDEDTTKLFYAYKQYCLEVGKERNTIENLFIDINFTNRFFQALKLSGALCIIEGNTTIDANTFAKAINIVEIINEDIVLFENELNKDNFEVVIDFCHIGNKESVDIPIHTLKRANLITSTQVKTQLDSLIAFANSKDEEGLYELNHDGTILKFKIVKKTNEYGVSYLQLPSSDKAKNAKICDKGYKYAQVEFSRLANMLKGNFAYSAFEFKNGKRDKEHCLPVCNMIVFDIDNSEVTIDEAHNMLSDMMHIVCSTSDKTNPYKFRVILPFDAQIEINNLIWTKLATQIAKDYLVGMEADILPQAQAFFAYKDSIVLTNDKGDRIKIKDYVSNVKAGKLLSDLTPKEKQLKLNNQYATFYYAYHQRSGSRNKTLVRVINDAYDLDAKYDIVLSLVKDINSSFTPPLDDESLKNVIKHLNKKYGKDKYEKDTLPGLQN